MSQAAAVTTATFDQEVLRSPEPVLVDFWAPWCGPCRRVAPEVDAVARQMSGQARVLKLDVDEEPEVAARYGVQSIPTLIIFKDGKVADQIVGAAPRTVIAEKLQAHV
jgi:thioredoxin 1